MDLSMAKLVPIALLIFAASAASAAPSLAYTNHTVEWFFNPNTNATSTNYSAWASSQTFNLGDFLIFNTTTNQTVIQTYNDTTYTICTDYEDSGNDVFVYSAGEEIGVPAVIPVPLTEVGPNYYFSDANGGIQCMNGMKFEIVVGKGLGLPPSLNQPPPPPYAEPPPDSSSPNNQGQITNAPSLSGCSRGFDGVPFGLVFWGFVFSALFVV
ncbi:early nodulin-like protein 18 [Tasmannia lanceolata]|uniref:early nodulin-like protein 18 n=1 Tax=Tasmannia lanceolata TaxID=3420 RepID=UPI004062B2A3